MGGHRVGRVDEPEVVVGAGLRARGVGLARVEARLPAVAPPGDAVTTPAADRRAAVEPHALVRIGLEGQPLTGRELHGLVIGAGPYDDGVTVTGHGDGTPDGGQRSTAPPRCAVVAGPRNEDRFGGYGIGGGADRRGAGTGRTACHPAWLAA